MRTFPPQRRILSCTLHFHRYNRALKTRFGRRRRLITAGETSANRTAVWGHTSTRSFLFALAGLVWHTGRPVSGEVPYALPDGCNPRSAPWEKDG